MDKNRWRVLVNFIAFQAGWFACIVSAARGWPLVGVIYVACWIGIHVYIIRNSKAVLLLVVASGLVGYIVDSALVLAGAFSFPQYARLAGPSPVWMAAMWCNLAGALEVSLGWLRDHYLLAAVLGAIFGPAAYGAGQAFGAIEFGEPAWLCTAAVSLEWAISLPLLYLISAGIRSSVKPDHQPEKEALS